MPYEVKSDFGQAFRLTWEEELDKLGVRVIHSSAYNSQSMGLVERSVQTLTEKLKKNKNITQLQLSEHIYMVNCKKEGETGFCKNNEAKYDILSLDLSKDGSNKC